MSWLGRLWRGSEPPALSAPRRERLDAWQALGRSEEWRLPLKDCTLDVVDVEASGLNLKRDSLIAIGCVRLSGSTVRASAAFERVLRQDAVSSDANILLHGIEGRRQREGCEPADALIDFLEFNGKRPLLAYHAFFDQGMLARAMKRYLGVDYHPPWLDLAWLLPALFPERISGTVALDAWLDEFGIKIHQRHNAVCDCLATAQLAMIAFERARLRGKDTLNDLAMLEASRRRMSRA